MYFPSRVFLTLAISLLYWQTTPCVIGLKPLLLGELEKVVASRLSSYVQCENCCV